MFAVTTIPPDDRSRRRFLLTEEGDTGLVVVDLRDADT
jgi:hypothetical protein